MKAEPFQCRGLDCFIVTLAPDRFGGIVMKDGAPVQVVWNKRTFWHKRHRARTMITQFVKCRFPVVLKEDCQVL